MPDAEKHRRALLSIFSSALQAVNGRRRVSQFLQQHPLEGPLYMIAAGKAAVAMAQGAMDILGERIVDGLIVTKYGHEEAMPWPVLTAGHPLPDEQSLAAGKALREFISRMDTGTAVLVLLSGGASTLLEALPAGVTLTQLREVNQWLLASGMDIAACNQVRKRLSLIKGGRLAQWLAPRSVRSLVISDVRGDNVRTIASGPLVAYEAEGTSTSLDRFLKASGAPNQVLQALKSTPDAPAPDDACFKKIHIQVIAGLTDALRAAGSAASELSYRPRIDQRVITGDAIVAGARLAHTLLHSPPGTLRIWGGETTITLPPQPGRGGRNQSLALSAALVLRGQKNALFLAAGTDGSDGPGDDAGAVIDSATVSRAADQGMDAEAALRQADAGRVLEASGDLIQTGPTGTNVMDLILGLRY